MSIANDQVDAFNSAFCVSPIILADDLTGAAEIALQFAHRGEVNVWVEAPETSFDADSTPTTQSVNLDLRAFTDAFSAFSFLEAWFGDACPLLPPHRTFFKMDSTWRGYPLSMALAGLGGLGKSRALLCPAYPQQGRTIQGGHAFLHDKPLHETEMGRDPTHPIHTSDVKKLLQAEAEALIADDLLDRVPKIRTGLSVDEALEILASPPSLHDEILVPDVSNQDALRTLAQGVLSLDSPPLLQGAGGFAQALFGENSGPNTRQNPPSFDEENCAVMSGSLNPTTRAQLSRLSEAHPQLAIFDSSAIPSKAWRAELLERFHHHLAVGKRLFVLCGGETAAYLLVNARVNMLHLVARLSAQLGLWRGGLLSGEAIFVILKSGNMGDADMLVDLFATLKID